MDSNSMRWGIAALPELREIEWGGVAKWLSAFGLVAYLGLEGGGYDPLVHDRVGIAVWWILIAGLLVGALPTARLSPAAWISLGLLAAFAAWTALSLIWTESVEQTFAEAARVAGYMGVFVLALLAWRPNGARRMAAAVAAGVSLVVVVALLSRLHPAWFPEAGQTAIYLESGRERLSYPLNYWNGLGALVAIALPLLLHLAADARQALVRGLAAAAMPALVLTAFFTLSRGGIGAAILAVAVYLSLTSDRLPKLLSALLSAAGGLLLILAASTRESLQDGLLTPAATEQGDEVLFLALLVCTAVGAIQALFAIGLGGKRRPRWSQVSPRVASGASVAAVGAAVVALLVVDAPGRAADAWDEFKQPSSAGKGAGRLGSAAGQSRYQYWSAAVKESATAPLIGTGSGTFKYWWARNGDNNDSVRDAHSLYMQTLGELGIVGVVLIAAFLLTVLLVGGRQALRGPPAERSAIAAGAAGCAAFAIAGAVDWVWQIPVLPIAFLLLASTVLAVPATGGARAAGFPWAGRLAGIAAAAAAIALIAIPLASTSLIRDSEANARSGDYGEALAAARSAERLQPGAASPLLQQALLLEELGDLAAASQAARDATEREATNWRPWLVLARIEAERGRAAAAVRAFRKARSLNPNSGLFQL
jgi:hypothetical protein